TILSFYTKSTRKLYNYVQLTGVFEKKETLPGRFLEWKLVRFGTGFMLAFEQLLVATGNNSLISSRKHSGTLLGFFTKRSRQYFGCSVAQEILGSLKKMQAKWQDYIGIWCGAICDLSRITQ